MPFSQAARATWTVILLMWAAPIDAAVWLVWATTVDDLDVGVTAAGRQVQNAVWQNHRVQLTTTGEETVACQIVLEGDDQGARHVVAQGPELWLDHGAGVIRDVSVAAATEAWPSGYGTRVSLFDPPLDAERQGAQRSLDATATLPRRGRLRLRLEIRVPRSQPPGVYRGGLVVNADRQRVLVPIDLLVRSAE